MIGWDGQLARQMLLRRFSSLLVASDHIGISESLLRRCLDGDSESVRACYVEWIAIASGVSMDYLCQRTANPQRSAEAAYYSDFWTRVRRILDENGYSLAKFCLVVGLLYEKFWSLFRVKDVPDVFTMCRIADTFNCSMDWLAGNTDERSVFE